MNSWLIRLFVGYSLMFFFHLIAFQTIGLGKPYWLGDLYWAGTGISLLGLAKSIDESRPGKFSSVYLFGGLIRMLLGVAIVALPIIIGEKDNFRQLSLEFVGAYIYCLILESIIAISWVKKQ